MNKITGMIYIITFGMILQKTTCIMHLEDNIFSELNAQLQNIINKIFTLLKLNKDFKTRYQNQILISLQDNMNSIAENHFKLFKDITLQCKYEVEHIFNDTLFILDKPLDQVIRNIFDEPHLPNITMQSHNQTNTSIANKEILRRNLESTKNNTNTHENIKKIFEFFKAHDSLMDYFTNKNKNETIKHDDFINKTNHKETKRNRTRTKELKLWKEKNTTKDKEVRRMFDGKHTTIRRYPFMAAIHIFDEYSCAGSILSRDYIITAATCLQIAYNNVMFLKDYPQSIGIRIGSKFAYRLGEFHLVSTLYFHPNYNPNSLENNLCIIKLDKSLRFMKKNKQIRRIEYQRTPGPIPESVKSVALIGWGNKGVNAEEDQLHQLTYAHVDLYNKTDCIEVYSTKFVKDVNFCVGYTNKGSGACPRDIGGPGVANSILVGVVSFGPPVCGTPDAPTVLTSLGYYTEWIGSIVKISNYTMPKPSIYFKPRNKLSENYYMNSGAAFKPKNSTTTTQPKRDHALREQRPNIPFPVHIIANISKAKNNSTSWHRKLLRIKQILRQMPKKKTNFKSKKMKKMVKVMTFIISQMLIEEYEHTHGADHDMIMTDVEPSDSPIYQTMPLSTQINAIDSVKSIEGAVKSIEREEINTETTTEASQVEDESDYTDESSDSESDSGKGMGIDLKSRGSALMVPVATVITSTGLAPITPSRTTPPIKKIYSMTTHLVNAELKRTTTNRANRNAGTTKVVPDFSIVKNFHQDDINSDEYVLLLLKKPTAKTRIRSPKIQEAAKSMYSQNQPAYVSAQHHSVFKQKKDSGESVRSKFVSPAKLRPQFKFNTRPKLSTPFHVPASRFAIKLPDLLLKKNKYLLNHQLQSTKGLMRGGLVFNKIRNQNNKFQYQTALKLQSAKLKPNNNLLAKRKTTTKPSNDAIIEFDKYSVNSSVFDSSSYDSNETLGDESNEKLERLLEGDGKQSISDYLYLT